ncbi:MAG: cyclic lactone autoinducer peptide [Bacillota bacterium]
MFKKSWFFGLIASIAMLVASTGVYPASWGLWYQPKHPSQK